MSNIDVSEIDEFNKNFDELFDQLFYETETPRYEDVILK